VLLVSMCLEENLTGAWYAAERERTMELER